MPQVMRPRQFRRITARAVFMGVGVLAGLAFVAVRGSGDKLVAGAVGATIALGIIATDELIERTELGRRLRQLPLVAVSLAVTAAYLAVILPTIAVANHGLTGAWQLEATTVLYSFGISLLFSTANRIGRLIGWRVMGNLVIGRYSRPIAEERIFLFLDLVNSTGLAERLGETRMHQLIAQFYFDIAQPIAEHGGEIYQYRGDEISVTWPMQAGARDASCIACAFAIRGCIDARADAYRHRFDTVPAFRIGLLGGIVVAGEVGDQRREIMYFGDTINTAARIQALCKREGRDTCISAGLLARVGLPAGVQATSLGRVHLRGKKQETEIFSLAPP